MGSIPATLVISPTYKYKHVTKTKRKKSFLTKRKKPSDFLVKRIKRTFRSTTVPLLSSVVSRPPRPLLQATSSRTRPKQLKIRLNRVTRFNEANSLNRIPHIEAFSKGKSIFFSFQKTSNSLPFIKSELGFSAIHILSLWKIVSPLKNLNTPISAAYCTHSLIYPFLGDGSRVRSFSHPTSYLYNVSLLFENGANQINLQHGLARSQKNNTLRKLDQVRSNTSFFYTSFSQIIATRAISLKFYWLQKTLCDSLLNHKFLNDRLTELNIIRKRKRHNYAQLLLHKVSSRLTFNFTSREQLPHFSHVISHINFRPSKVHSVFIWTKFFSEYQSNSLRRKSTGLGLGTELTSELIATPNHKSLQVPTKTTRHLKTHLLARTLRHFMRRRLFRGKPIRTFLRSLRHSRRSITRFRKTNLILELQKKHKKIQALLYEKALFEEILSSPKGTQGPLLRSLLYTGFEQMPLLDQKFGNKLFLKRRKLRTTIFQKKIPKRQMRRYEIRDFLRQHTPWAQRIEKFRLLVRAVGLIDALPNYFHLSPEEIRKKSKKTRRYWRKRVAFFARRSSVFRWVRRSTARFKRRKNSRFKFLLSRNFRVKVRAYAINGLKQTKVKFSRKRSKLRKRRKKRQNSKLTHEFLRLQSTVNSRTQLLTKFNNLKNRQFYYGRRLRKSLKRISGSKHKLYTRNNSLLRPLFRDSYFNTLFPTQVLSEQPQLILNSSNRMLSKAISVPFGYTAKFWQTPLFVKYFFLTSFDNSIKNLSSLVYMNNYVASKKFITTLQHQLEVYSFNTIADRIPYSNAWSFFSSQHVLQKKLLRSISQMVFKANVGTWSQRCLLNFLEHVSGRKVAINIGPFVEHILTIDDHARCFLWDNRSSGFKKLLGHRIFTSEAVMLVTAALRLKDPTLLANWIRGMLQRMSFWKYRILFRYLKFLIQHLFRFNFTEFGFKGFKLRLKGKISVGGNSRSRVLFYRVGDTSHSKMSSRVAYDLSYINTFTGILGFKLWFFY